MRARNALLWTLSAAYAVMWTGGIVTTCWPSAGAQPAWAAPLFLLLAASIMALGSAEVLTLILFAAGGILAELIGVHTGVPFGRYSYTAALGPSLSGVPLAIACAWLTTLLFARDLAWRTTTNRWTAATLGAVIMTALDLLIDPVATRILGYWRWEQPGIFFGVPLVNFVGWCAVSALLLAAAPRPNRRPRTTLWIGGTVVCFFAAIAAAQAVRTASASSTDAASSVQGNSCRARS